MSNNGNRRVIAARFAHFGRPLGFTLNAREPAGFTLIELLVVIAIIALLAAILFPVFAQAREKARETTCLSNTRQIGLAVRMYVSDYDEQFPIFHAYNTQPAGGQIGHKGVEVELSPYAKNSAIFRCPNDNGGPVPQNSPSGEYGCKDLPGKNGSYYDCYGSSYRFTAGSFTMIGGINGSLQNNTPIDGVFAPHDVSDAAFQYPSETRLMRDEMLPWFGPEQDPNGTVYGYYPDYYRQWHGRGGGFVFADGHAKFVVTAAQFRAQRLTPDGKTFEECGYACD